MESVLNNEWDEYAENWNVDPSVEKYAAMAFSELTKKIKLDGLSVLDFGCGTGVLTQMIGAKVRDVVAIDPSSEMIKYLDMKTLKNVSTISDFLTEELINKRSEFENKFDLIVASSVCGFLPSYEETLCLLKSLLKEDGSFVQWDWLADDQHSGVGLSIDRVKKVFDVNQFIDVQITTPFIMENSKGSMTVLMAYGKNISQVNKVGL